MRRLVAQDHQVFTEDGQTVALFGDGIMLRDDADWEQRKADARLFAASPDLLDALKRCEAMVSTDQGPPNWDWVRETIAKASS